MKKLAPYIRCVVFVIGMIGIVAIADFLLAPTGYINYMLRHVDDKEVEYDGYILGASHARCSTDPEKIEDQTGEEFFNASVPGETVKDSYYLIQQLESNHDVKRIVLDIDYNYWFGGLKEGSFEEAFMYNQYDWSTGTKWKYLVENAENLDFRNAVSNRETYCYDFREIKKNVRHKRSASYKNADMDSLDFSSVDGVYKGKGFFAMNLPAGNPVGEKYFKKQMGIQKENISSYPKKYFRKLAKYCKKHDIELICVTSPITPSSMKCLGIDEAYGKLSALLEECDVTYFDMNRLRFDVLHREDQDYIDKEGHMGGELASRYSEVLAALLDDYWNGTLEDSEYLYDSYEQMYENMGE